MHIALNAYHKRNVDDVSVMILSNEISYVHIYWQTYLCVLVCTYLLKKKKIVFQPNAYIVSKQHKTHFQNIFLFHKLLFQFLRNFIIFFFLLFSCNLALFQYVQTHTHTYIYIYCYKIHLCVFVRTY